MRKARRLYEMEEKRILPCNQAFTDSLNKIVDTNAHQNIYVYAIDAATRPRSETNAFRETVHNGPVFKRAQHRPTFERGVFVFWVNPVRKSAAFEDCVAGSTYHDHAPDRSPPDHRVITSRRMKVYYTVTHDALYAGPYVPVNT